MTTYRQAKTLVEIVRELKGIGQGGSGGPRGWAYALRDREQRGEELSEAQRAMWRAALNADGPIFAKPLTSDADVNDRKNQLQRQADSHPGSRI